MATIPPDHVNATTAAELLSAVKHTGRSVSDVKMVNVEIDPLVKMVTDILGPDAKDPIFYRIVMMKAINVYHLVGAAMMRDLYDEGIRDEKMKLPTHESWAVGALISLKQMQMHRTNDEKNRVGREIQVIADVMYSMVIGSMPRDPDAT